MTSLHKPIRRLAQVSNGGGWQSAWIVSLEPGRIPLVTFRLPRRRTVYAVPLAKCLDLAEKAAAAELMNARRMNRKIKKAVKP